MMTILPMLVRVLKKAFGYTHILCWHTSLCMYTHRCVCVCTVGMMLLWGNCPWTRCGYVTTVTHVHRTQPKHETYNHFHFMLVLVSYSLCVSGHVLFSTSHSEELVMMILLLHVHVRVCTFVLYYTASIACGVEGPVHGALVPQASVVL